MKDIIKSIKAVNGIKNKHGMMEGYTVFTDKHEYLMIIDEKICCCGIWKCFESEDDLQYFVGADLINVQLTDTLLNKAKLKELDNIYLECTEIQLINFETDRGVFQLPAYRHSL